MEEEGELLIFAGGSWDGKSINHGWIVPGDPGNNRLVIPVLVDGIIESECYRRIPGTNVFQWEGEPAVEPDCVVESR